MKRTLFLLVGLIAALTISPVTAGPVDHPGYVDLSFVDQYAGDDVKVEVNINKALLGLAGALTPPQPGMPELKPLLDKLEQVTVRVIDAAKRDQTELRSWMEGVTRKLRDKGWQPVASVRERGQESVQVLMLMTAEQISGILVTILNPKGEAVFVNVVGDINLEALASIGKTLNLPGLDLKLGRNGAIDTRVRPVTPVLPLTPVQEGAQPSVPPPAGEAAPPPPTAPPSPPQTSEYDR